MDRPPRKTPHMITPNPISYPSIDPIIPTPPPPTPPFCYQPTHSATTNPNLPPPIHTLSPPTSIPNPPPTPPTPTITTYRQTLPNTPCHYSIRPTDRAASSRPHTHGPPLRHTPNFDHGNNPGLHGCQINVQMHPSPR